MISCGWMVDFKGSEMLLFVCDRPGVEAFAAVLRNLVTVSEARHVWEACNSAEVAVRPNQRIRLVGAKEPHSRITVREEHGIVNIEWVVSTSSVPRIVDALSALSQSPVPAHAYVEDDGEATVMVSVDEYESGFIQSEALVIGISCQRISQLLRDVAAGRMSADEALTSDDWALTNPSDTLKRAWHALQHFAADGDIRSADSEYAERQTRSLMALAEELLKPTN